MFFFANSDENPQACGRFSLAVLEGWPGRATHLICGPHHAEMGVQLEKVGLHHGKVVRHLEEGMHHHFDLLAHLVAGRDHFGKVSTHHSKVGRHLDSVRFPIDDGGAPIASFHAPI